MNWNPLLTENKLAHPLIAGAVKKVSEGGFTPGPKVVDLDPTTACDLDCPECISSGVLRSGGLSFDRLSKLADELREVGTVGVVLIGGGEPLMHQRFADILRALKANDLQIGLVTNGTMLDRYLDVIAATTTWVRVSWDAGTNATYARIRPSRSGRNLFHRVVANTASMAQMGGPTVGVSFVAFPPEGREDGGNLEDLHIAISKAAEIGCSYLEVKGLLDQVHNVVRYSADSLRVLQEAVTVGQREVAGKLEIYLSHNLQLLISAGSTEQLKTYHECPSASLRTLIAPNGVYPCAYHRGNEQLSYGSIRNSELTDLWRPENVRKVDPTTDCNFFCARHALNESILGGIREGNSNDEIRDPFI